MIRVLHASRVESGNGKKLDLELFKLFNQVSRISKPNKEAPEDNGSLQSVQLAQVCKTNYEISGAATQDLTGPKKYGKSQSPNFGSNDIEILTRLVLA